MSQSFVVVSIQFKKRRERLHRAQEKYLRQDKSISSFIFACTLPSSIFIVNREDMQLMNCMVAADFFIKIEPESNKIKIENEFFKKY